MKSIKESFRFKILFFIFFFGLSLFVDAQKNYVLELHEGEKLNVLKLNDSLQVQQEVQEAIRYYLKKGHLEVRLDTVMKVENRYKAFLYVGQKYQWAKFVVSKESDVFFLKKTFLNLEEKKVDIPQFIELRAGLIKEANNQGYPYATFFLSEVQTKEDSLKAIINFSLGTKVVFDELLVEGDVVSGEFLQAYLGIKQNQLFSKDKINKIPYLIDKLKGVALAAPINIQFYKGICLIKLKLKKKAEDMIDALIGFQTNSEQKSEVIGNVNLSLNNLFRSSKKIELNWQKPTQLNQELDVFLDYPNFLLTNIGLDGGLELFKRDTSFLNVSYQIGVYYKSYQQTISFNVERQVSSLFNEKLKSDSLLSYKSVKSSLGYQLDKLIINDLRLKGYLFTSAVGIQQLSITDSSKIIPTTTLDVRFEGNLPLLPYLTCRQTLVGSAILADEIFVNQMKLVGGYNSIRGFNQNQFFSKRSLLFSSAFVFHLGENANLSTFSDYGFLLTANGNENLVSMGLGLDVKTNNTILNFAYALGQSGSQKFSLALSKIHVGIATKF